MPIDLDPADVPEVRRRVVEPVLAAMLNAGEAAEVHLAIEMPGASWWTFPDSEEEPTVWLRLRVEGEEFEHGVCKPGFWLDDAVEIAEQLADQLRDWICETSFGWGDLRSVPGAADLPGPPAVSPGARMITVHLHEAGGLPLWEDGTPADATSLGLSPTLLTDLSAWQVRAGAYAEAADARNRALAHPTGRSGVWMADVSERSMSTRGAAAAGRRQHALAQWHDWVADLEPLRDALVRRLRDELGDGFVVPDPPRLPSLS